MVFIETSIFTRQIRDLFSDEHVSALQEWIAESPTVRKPDQGKRGMSKAALENGRYREKRWNTGYLLLDEGV